MLLLAVLTTTTFAGLLAQAGSFSIGHYLANPIALAGAAALLTQLVKTNVKRVTGRFAVLAINVIIVLALAYLAHLLGRDWVVGETTADTVEGLIDVVGISLASGGIWALFHTNDAPPTTTQPTLFPIN